MKTLLLNIMEKYLKSLKKWELRLIKLMSIHSFNQKLKDIKLNK